MELIPYGKQWIDEADIAAVNAVLMSDYLTQGPAIEEFENEIKKITGAKFCVAVSNATVGLHIAVAALELKSGMEGIATPITFVASANCIVSNNLIPIFADIDSKTYNISPMEIEKKITSKTKILIPVDFAGQAVDIEAIKNIADKHNLCIIEDAAHAIGSFYKDGMPVGCCHKADITVFSFHPVKTITSGEGGAITTNDEQIYRKLLKLRTIGITKNANELSQNPGTWYYEMQSLGTNARLTDIQAALGKSQLSKLQLFKERRREIVNKYNEAFEKIPHLTIPYEENKNSSCFDFLSTPFDEEAADFLEKLGVEAYKIASFELVHIPLLKHVARKGKPMIVSCGMGSEEEIGEAVDAMIGEGLSKEQIILLKCTSEYPANFEDMNLLTIPDMISRFGVRVGLSDHSMGSLAAVVGTSLGACLIEKHFCLSRAIKNPDSDFSMEPHEFSAMVKDVNEAAKIRGRVNYELTETEKASKVFRRSVFAIKDIKKGEAFTKENVRCIRPGYGMKPKYYHSLLEKKSNRDYKRGEPIGEI